MVKVYEAAEPLTHSMFDVGRFPLSGIRCFYMESWKVRVMTSIC